MTNIAENAGESQELSVPTITLDRRNFKLPEALRSLEGWICWKFESAGEGAKPLKVPYYCNDRRRAGKQGSNDDRSKLAPYGVALRRMIDRPYDGVGLAMLDTWGLTAIDIDNCVGPNGELPEIVQHLVARTYTEYSPSGHGVRAFLRGNLGNHKSPTKGNEYGLETFYSTGFVTITGRVLPDCELIGTDEKIGEVDDYIRELCERRFGPLSRPDADPDDPFAGLAPRHNMSVGDMEALLAKLDPDMGRDTWIRVGMALHHETMGDDTGFYIWNEWSSQGSKYVGEDDLRTQWTSFDRREGSRQQVVTMGSVKKMVRDLAAQADEPGAIGEETEWPDPLPLPEALPSVPPMTPDMLPEGLRDFAVDVAERMSVPLDFTGVPAVIMASSLIGSRMTVRPERHTDWTEAGNTWGCIIASPGALKTPAIREVLAPLRELETEAQIENERAREKYRTDQAFQKLARESADKESKTLLGSGDEAGAYALLAAVREPEPPLEKRFVTSDVSVEKLGELCAANPNGILLHRDELLSQFADLDREEKAAARGFMLTAWTGLDQYTFDRIGRGRTHIDTVNVSLMGTAQPRRLVSYMRKSLQNFDDGLVQRLQLAVWPDISSEWQSGDRVPDTAARKRAFACCRRLAALTPADVDATVEDQGSSSKRPYLRFSPDALRAFNEWRSNLEQKVRGGSLSDPLAAHLSKYRGLIPRLALILHLASDGKGPIPLGIVKQAMAWADYLEAHARRIYAAVEAEKADTARAIWRRVEAGDIQDAFTARDIYSKGWSGLQNRGLVQDGLEALVEANWLRLHNEKTGGRPTVKHSINPRALRGSGGA